MNDIRAGGPRQANDSGPLRILVGEIARDTKSVSGMQRVGGKYESLACRAILAPDTLITRR